MAQKVQVLLVDDLDGGDATETVTFALDGVTYEIDLNDTNAAKLRDDMSAWTGHGRRISARAGSRRPAGTTRPRRSASGVDTGAIRDWARKNGHQVSDRGRISSTVLEAYQKANG